MSMNTTFKTYNELTEYLSTVDHPQCFTVNYLPDSGEYALWIGNQPYYAYEKWIEEEEQKVRELKQKNQNLLNRLNDCLKNKVKFAERKNAEIDDLKEQLKEVLKLSKSI